jgi:gliding motility-associated-like protein
MNGCKGSDSSRITVLYPVPTLFLPADTAVCSYGKLDLKSTSSFQTYLWNNNQSTSLITINKPGLYWLQVKDRNNCYGTDSILVAQKQCMTGFFIPTAFTPDGNHLNDDIKPFVFGNVLKYEFVIYNRWGQIVFQSNDLLKGWDGIFKGIQQDPGIYSWICRYQLEGEQQQLQKGTIILIR